MKKFCLLLCIFFITGLVNISYAAVDIKVSPNINVVINGEKTTYTNVPIKVNGITLLPLIETLQKFGVQNDNKHIMWDSKKKTIIILKGNKKVSLQVGSKSAMFNGTKKVLDVAPVIYKNIIYIEPKFVAESFGQKALWDEKNYAVIFYLQSEFDKVKNVITKADNLIISSKNYRVNQHLILDGGEDYREEHKIDVTVNMKDKTAHIVGCYDIKIFDDINNTSNFENYLTSEFLYQKNSSLKKWIKTKLTGSTEEVDFIKREIYAGVLGNYLSECNIAGLTVKNDATTGSLILEGDVGTNEFTDTTYRSYNPHTRIVVNNKTYLYQERVLTINYVEHDGGQYNFTQTDNGYEINGEYDFSLPEEVINSELFEPGS